MQAYRRASLTRYLEYLCKRGVSVHLHRASPTCKQTLMLFAGLDSRARARAGILSISATERGIPEQQRFEGQVVG